MLREVLETAKLGRVRLFGPEVTARHGWPAALTGGSHHMGTTRMHEDTRFGVVDAHGRVHDMDNLYIAGSSVFPTAGASNPTLTIAALALRLADHLREQHSRTATRSNADPQNTS
jgi:choline dehydrogenase-like flavoprotein